LLGRRRWVHKNEESYVVVHCGPVGELVYLSFSEMALNIEESVYNSLVDFTARDGRHSLVKETEVEWIHRNVRGEIAVYTVPCADPNPVR